MPSDERMDRALEAMASQRDAFRSALGTTVEQVQSFLNEYESPSTNGRAERIGAELGPFAAGRIDTGRLASLVSDEKEIDALTLETIAKARDTIRELVEMDGALFSAQVPPGGNLYKTVHTALEEIGRAFGAVRIFELTRSGSYRGNEHARSLGSFPFDKWSKGERRLAPPLVVSVDGADLKAGLSDFLDGAQKIVLVVRAPCAPAPLVRLITPRTFVLQTTDPADLAKVAEWDGPGVAAIVPDECARFAHDPAAGTTPWQRLTIHHLPERPPRLTIGGKSGAQQAEELAQLRALAERPAAEAAEAAGGAGAPVPPAPADPVDKLAAWLLQQADLKDT
ncbi:MAG: hypothetical protein PVF27_04255 [Gemmatimonadales bacterium]|jgi:hypothetical protein